MSPQEGKIPVILVVEDDLTTQRLLCSALEASGITAVSAFDGIDALEQIHGRSFDLMLLDLGLPRMNGLELLDRLHRESISLKVIVITGDEAPETVLQAVCHQAYRYILKPFSIKSLVELVRTTLAIDVPPPPIEVLSARPEWVELLVPCDLESAERIRNFMDSLENKLPKLIRESIGQAFGELLLNAIEWGGKFDSNRKVRISCLRTKRMLLYRIADPGSGFQLEGMAHAAVNNPQEEPLRHSRIREEMHLRPGGFGILLVKSIVDELIFNEAHNEVVFIKYLD